MSNKNIIESKDNSKVKLINSLKTKKFREKHGLMIFEGLRATNQLIELNISLEIIAFSENAYNEFEEYRNIYENYKDISIIIKDNLFNQISDTVNTQGIIAVSRIPNYNLEQLLKKDVARILMFDRVQDPGNAGTLIRTADAAGFDAILSLKGTVDLYSPKVNRSAMGSNIYIPIIEIEETDIRNLKQNGFKILATALDEYAQTYDKAIYTEKCVIVLGNEANGVSENIIAMSDQKVYIPIYGKAESLNVGIAGAIVMYKSLEK